MKDITPSKDPKDISNCVETATTQLGEHTHEKTGDVYDVSYKGINPVVGQVGIKGIYQRETTTSQLWDDSLSATTDPIKIQTGITAHKPGGTYDTAHFQASQIGKASEFRNYIISHPCNPGLSRQQYHDCLL